MAVTTVDETLAATLRDAVALQPVAEDALAALSSGEDTVGIWARAASRLAGRYCDLLTALPTDTPQRRRAAVLLDYHQHLLRQTMRFACSLDHVADRRELSRRQAGAGFGPPGAELRRLLAESAPVTRGR
ncbi:hypothetical protein [Cryptosporangium aurantiacum]|uniref:Uncharacterized protein n=1 Tax=Cryptosporangium aurantiacum TaxID=134849 RepID=A0A1M7TX97_9ACTN|nr:hypothetical protein [Cryptosporangium aurantiacum]SHN75342.1 hypothetical protein SAMN05443668_107274 [Cryptosporangium aurantiacum]